MSDGEIAALLAELRPLRSVMLDQLEILGELGFVPKDRVAAIRAGSGSLDAARDAVAIGGLFAEFEGALANKHPFTPEQLATVSRLGNSLVAVLSPTGAKEGPAVQRDEAAIRDALYAELLTRYEALREAAVATFGLKELDTHVPPAHSRLAKKTVKKPV
jgi:hypothetical protein